MREGRAGVVQDGQELGQGRERLVDRGRDPEEAVERVVARVRLLLALGALKTTIVQAISNTQ